MCASAEVPSAPAACTSKWLTLCYVNLIFKKITQLTCSSRCSASGSLAESRSKPKPSTGGMWPPSWVRQRQPLRYWAAAVPVHHLGAPRATGRAPLQDTRTPCSPCCSEPPIHSCPLRQEGLCTQAHVSPLTGILRQAELTPMAMLGARGCPQFRFRGEQTGWEPRAGEGRKGGGADPGPRKDTEAKNSTHGGFPGSAT